MGRARVVNVEKFLNEQPFGSFQWLIFSMCFVIVLLDGFDTAAIGFLAPSLINEWHIAKPDLAPVLSAALVRSGSLSWVKNRILVLGTALRIFTAACKPFISGIPMSRITRWGRNPNAFWTALTPSQASPMI